LNGLEQLAFGLDARRNDDFGLLKFPDGRRADIAHAGGDGANRFCDPSSTVAGPKRICLSEPLRPTLMRVPRGRLACGVAMPNGFPRPGASLARAKALPTIHGIRAAGQRLADVAALAHAPSVMIGM